MCGRFVQTLRERQLESCRVNGVARNQCVVVEHLRFDVERQNHARVKRILKTHPSINTEYLNEHESDEKRMNERFRGARGGCWWCGEWERST